MTDCFRFEGELGETAAFVDAVDSSRPPVVGMDEGRVLLGCTGGSKSGLLVLGPGHQIS
jgi:hypothetical protein